MPALDRYHQDIEQIEQTLCSLASLYTTPGKQRTLMAFDREHGQFLLLDEGWDGYRRIHHVWAHVEVRDGKLWIHEDGTEEGIANLLVAAGISRDRIVLALDPSSLRDTGQFAIA
ncbi:MAG TPA: XisI protein [Chthonomonadaceae bacterium]|nr:XisI protein [Chthonomonadaceae bacterium]